MASEKDKKYISKKYLKYIGIKGKRVGKVNDQ